MKKWIAVFLGLILIFCFVSCHTPKEEKPENPPPYPQNNIFTESDTTVAFIDNTTMQFYDKVDSRRYLFCFEPLCRHTSDDNCIATKFMNGGKGEQNIRYCPYDNRYYALRGHKVCSFSVNGTDLKTVYSFGEEGDTARHAYYTSAFTDLTVKGRYLYFIGTARTSDHQNLYRYDIENEKMDTFFHKDGNSVESYILGEDTVFLELSGHEDYGIYVTDVAGKTLKLISTDKGIHLKNGVYDGETVWCTVRNEQLLGYHVKENRLEYIYTENSIRRIDILAVKNGEIYFSLGEEGDYSNQICKIDPETSVCRTVLPRGKYVAKGLYFMGDTVLIDAIHKMQGYGTHLVLPMKLSSDGNFVNLEKDAPENIPMAVPDIRKAEIIDPEGNIPYEPPETEESNLPLQTSDTFRTFQYAVNLDPKGNPRNQFPPKRKFNAGGLYGEMPDLLFLRVVGVEKEEKGSTYYRIQFADVYGRDSSLLDRKRVLTMVYDGTAEEQAYRNPPLETNTVYAVLSSYNSISEINKIEEFHGGYQLFKTEQGEDGKWYLYSFNADLSCMDCKIPIVNSVENSIYQKGKHDLALAYLRDIKKTPPVFEYKCEVTAFLAEIRYRNLYNLWEK